MSTKEFQIYMTEAKGLYYAEFQVPPTSLNVINETENEIVFQATGKDLNGKEISAEITIRKRYND